MTKALRTFLIFVFILGAFFIPLFIHPVFADDATSTFATSTTFDIWLDNPSIYPMIFFAIIVVFLLSFWIVLKA